MTRENVTESRAIDWLWFPMAAAVVMNHTGSHGVWSAFPVYSTLCIAISEAVCRIAVPLFFVFAGYLFFEGFKTWDKGVYLGRMKRCLKKIVVPYLLWNILAAVLLYSYSYLRMRLGSVPHVSLWEQLRQWKWIRIFWDCDNGLPLNYSLWYFRDLILYLALSPLFLWVFGKVKWAGVLILGIAYLFVDSFHFLGGLFFFSLGCQLRLSRKSILETCFSLRWPALVSSALLLPAVVLTFRAHPQVSGLLMRLFVCCGFFATFYLVSSAFRRHRLKDTPFLQRCAFFTLAAHGILILNDFAHYIMLHTLPLEGEAYYCIDLFLRPTLAIVMCIGLYWIMSKITPRTLGLLTGGRAKTSKAYA